MEVEECSSLVATKLSKTLSIVFYMLKKGLSKSKLRITDLHLMLKRQHATTSTRSSLMLHHHYAASSVCRSTDVATSYVSPRKEYEFSCSNTPLIRRRNKSYYQYRHKYTQQRVYSTTTNRSIYEGSVEASPAISLPGFGKSPGRQLRVSDSPFSIKDAEENTDQLDKAAEEFIRKFYKELEKQKSMAPPLSYYSRAY
ncbi:hypothetical protein DCAR_0313653 [Daucus carota subsp. sativus]|uniref:Uncharacterized protein n=1 Tax=Daucus carota subsp. sativus TaxID=79200 RepID=A0A166C4X1_DAUCS|nr:hypothetical protein DCAR_0313653 [Daucus carota subsp. sativus]